MAEEKQLVKQVDRILDEVTTPQVEVIVQMESERNTPSQLARAAGEALSRRRLSLTPRDLLPESYGEAPTKQERQETASTRTLLGKATVETLALAQIQRIGRSRMNPLLKNGVVRAALTRMTEPTRKSAPAKSRPTPFWTSQAIPLRLKRDELRELPREVPEIKSIHRNRHLNVPALMETKKLQIEEEGILVSTWGLEQIKALVGHLTSLSPLLHQSGKSA